MESKAVQLVLERIGDLAANPAALPSKLRKLAQELLAVADRLEQGENQGENPTKDTAGVGDQVRINVVGPNGNIKQSVDTGG